MERRLDSNRGLRAAFDLLCWEGAFAMAYDTWVGPTYLTGLAGEVGVGVGLVSLFVAAPWIGAIGQLLGGWAYERFPSTKAYTVNLAAASRALWMLPLFFAAFWGWRSFTSGAVFPTRNWFAVVSVVAILGALLGSSSAQAWMSWTRALIPPGFRGRFFGVRMRYTMTALIVANLLASVWVGWKPGGQRLGYAVIASLALLAAAISTSLLAKVPEGERPPRAERASFLDRCREPLRDRRYRRLLLYWACFNFSIQIGGPYFPYWFTRELHIPMSTVAIWGVLNNLGCLLAASYWGRRLDRVGDARGTLRLVSFCIAAAPLPYLLPAHLIPWMAPVEYFENGFIASGFLLASTTLLYSICPEGRNTMYFSLYTAAGGVAGVLANLLGAQLAQWLAPWGGFRALWVVASSLRFATVVFAFPLLIGMPRRPGGLRAGADGAAPA